MSSTISMHSMLKLGASENMQPGNLKKNVVRLNLRAKFNLCDVH